MMYTSESQSHVMAAEIFTLELANARQCAKRAKLDLERAEELLDEGGGVAINIALCSRIGSARRRVIEARERIRNIDPASRIYGSDAR